MAGETILFPCQLLDILFALPSRCHLGGLPIHLEGLPNSSGVAPGYLFTSLLRFEAVRRRVADRIQRHFHGAGEQGGSFRPERVLPQVRELANRLQPAFPAELARWGSYREGAGIPPRQGPAPELTAEHWKSAQSFLERVIVARHRKTLLSLKARGLIPDTPAPAFHCEVGQVPERSQLLFAEHPGELFYTLTGADPYQSGGLASGARRYEGALTLPSGRHEVRARIRHEDEWGPLLQAWIQVGEPPTKPEKAQLPQARSEHLALWWIWILVTGAGAWFFQQWRALRTL